MSSLEITKAITGSLVTPKSWSEIMSLAIYPIEGRNLYFMSSELLVITVIS